jgi:Fic family protein
MVFRADRPYNDLPLLPPRAELETRPVLKACILAREAIAAARMAAHLIPNPDILLNTIPILEAQASSEIENIVTTTDRLFRFANDPGSRADPATREALRYRAALREGSAALTRRPLSVSTAVLVCRAIRDVEVDIRSTTGTVLANERTGATIYTPPEGETLLREKLANWEAYLHAEDGIDPLVKMAVAHYQFEAIHPFTDGNGRTGRILNLLYLVEAGLLESPTLYLSKPLLRRRSEYYQRLLEVTIDEAWEPWVLFMVEAVRETSEWTSAKIAAIRDLMADTEQTIRTRAPKLPAHDLVQVIFTQPYCRVANLVERDIARRHTAMTYLKALAELGLLRERREGRENLFLNPAFLALLSAQDP